MAARRCQAFITDQNESWYIENCSGTQYAAIRLNDDLLFLEPNMAVIGSVDLDDTENVIASPKLIETAKAAGTFQGSEIDNVIDYRASYAGRRLCRQAAGRRYATISTAPTTRTP